MNLDSYELTLLDPSENERWATNCRGSDVSQSPFHNSRSLVEEQQCKINPRKAVESHTQSSLVLQSMIYENLSKGSLYTKYQIISNVNPYSIYSYLLTDTAMLISELTRFDSFYIFFHRTPRVFTM